MSDMTRRDVVRRLGLALVATGTLDRPAAAEIHLLAGHAQAMSGGAYQPKTFTPHEYATLERLADLIVPVENGRPGAVAAGAPAWIDLISSENARLQTIYHDGIAWLDRRMKARGAADFVSAGADEQTRLLDRIAFRRSAVEEPELAPGVEFFAWVRRMTVDAFYTSEIGIRDIDYRGNTAMASYPPPVEAIEYALKRAKL